jgi:hypothetical protein
VNPCLIKPVPSTHSDNRCVVTFRGFTRVALYVLAAVSVYWILRQPIHTRLVNLFDPFSFSGDALQHIAPLWFVRDPGHASHDYIATYYLAAILPPLFKGIYAVVTLFTSPLAASKVITFLLSLLFVITTTLTSKRLAGGAAAYLTLLFASGAVLKNFYFMGGIQRGFGIWLASLALFYTCSGRIVPLGVIAILAAMVYPAASVFILVLLTVLLLLPKAFRGSAEHWALRKRFVFLTCCGTFCALAVLPQILGGSHYGPRLSKTDEAVYQEWSSSGRYTDGDRGVPIPFFERVGSSVVSAISASRVKAKKHTSATSSEGDKDFDLSPSQEGYVVMVFTLFCALWILYHRRCAMSAEAVRCGVFAGAMCLSFIAATALFPLLYISSRYIALGCIPLTPVVCTCLWSGAVSTLLQRRKVIVQTGACIALGAGLFVWLGWLHPAIRELPSASGHLPLFRFVRTLPADSIIAGWPRGVINQIPLFTAHTALLFEEGHQIFHRDYLEELRSRMRDLIALYAATDSAPLTELISRYKVSHILLDLRHLEKPPPYFAPFDAEMKHARAATEGKPLLLAELAKTRAIFQLGHLVLIDVSAIQ